MTDGDGRQYEVAGPSFTTWRGLKFVKGEAVDVADPDTVAKAKGNQFFKVDDGEAKRGPGRPRKEVSDGDENAG